MLKQCAILGWLLYYHVLSCWSLCGKTVSGYIFMFPPWGVEGFNIVPFLIHDLVGKQDSLRSRYSFDGVCVAPFVSLVLYYEPGPLN